MDGEDRKIQEKSRSLSILLWPYDKPLEGSSKVCESQKWEGREIQTDRKWWEENGKKKT